MGITESYAEAGFRCLFMHLAKIARRATVMKRYE